MGRLSYRADRRYVVTVDGPDGPVHSEPLEASAQAYPTAVDLARQAFPGISDLYVDLHGQRPPWLRIGQLVRTRPSEDNEAELAWVGQFIQGGVLVNALESGVGIYAPEDLDNDPVVTAAERAEAEAYRKAIGQD